VRMADFSALEVNLVRVRLRQGQRAPAESMPRWPPCRSTSRWKSCGRWSAGGSGFRRPIGCA
jgi:hypothetical protein